jgi:hypothetical protein
MQVMIRTKEFEIWKTQAPATLVGIPRGATPEAADIRGAGGIQEAADIRAEGTQGADIQGADIPAGILEAIPEGAVGEVILGAEAEGPTGDEELQRKALKTTPKCSR